MRSLILVRHAKSDWDDPELPDHDRPLARRGRRDAPRMAERLAASGQGADVILSSTAVRAHATAEAFALALGVGVSTDERHYGVGPRELLDIVAERPETRVLVVAHDPGLSILARHFEPTIPHMPTCAVAGFTWAADTWEAAFSARPEAFRYDIPRDA